MSEWEAHCWRCRATYSAGQWIGLRLRKFHHAAGAIFELRDCAYCSAQVALKHGPTEGSR